MRWVVVALFCTVLAGGLVAVVAGRMVVMPPVYSASELQADVAHDPGAWVGKTVLVRGVATGGYCPRNALCIVWPPVLLTAGASPPAVLALGAPQNAGSLPLVPGPADPLLAFLRRLPLVGRFAPGPQALHPGTPATYRVQIEARSATSCGAAACYHRGVRPSRAWWVGAPFICGAPTCYAAVVLDADPASFVLPGHGLAPIVVSPAIVIQVRASVAASPSSPQLHLVPHEVP